MRLEMALAQAAPRGGEACNKQGCSIYRTDEWNPKQSCVVSPAKHALMGPEGRGPPFTLQDDPGPTLGGNLPTLALSPALLFPSSLSSSHPHTSPREPPYPHSDRDHNLLLKLACLHVTSQSLLGREVRFSSCSRSRKTSQLCSVILEVRHCC